MERWRLSRVCKEGIVFRRFFTSLKFDIPSSIAAFLVALPLCMGIAIASGVPVAAGLITGIVGGIVVGRSPARRCK